MDEVLSIVAIVDRRCLVFDGVMAYAVMACIVMAYVFDGVATYIVMAYIYLWPL